MNFFFLEYVLTCYFFRPLTFCRNFFWVDGVEKVGIPLLLLYARSSPI